jgi:hypothetical protein
MSASSTMRTPSSGNGWLTTRPPGRS